MAGITVNVHQAKARLSSLLNQALGGKEVIIARANKPLVRLIPIKAATAKRRAGLNEGAYRVADNFDEPLPDDLRIDKRRR